jgi:hypothetical protein
LDDLSEKNRELVESIIKNSGTLLPRPSEED